MKKTFTLLMLILGFFVSSTAYAQFTAFTIPGATNTYVTCINDSGDVGGYYEDGTGTHGFLFKLNQSDTVIFNYPGAAQTFVYGVNNADKVIGAYNYTGVNTDNEGFTCDVFGTYTDITTSWISGMDITIGRDINDAGCMVGDYKQSTTHVCFSMCGGNNVSFHYNYNPTYINSLNNTGKRAGFWIDGSYRHGLIYDYGNWTEIDYPGATRTMFTSVNDSNIAVGVFNLTRSFLYRNGVFKEIKKADATDFQIRDINNEGMVCGYFKDASNVYKGFFMPVWDIGFRPNPDGWNFGNTMANIWPSSWTQQFDYRRDPYLGGFSSFPKMTYSDGTIDTINRRFFPDWPLFVESVGEDQCYNNLLGFRYLKNSSFLRYRSLLRWWGGSCFGFVQSSFMAWDSIQRFKVEFPLVGPWTPSNKLYQLSLTDENRKCINKLMVRQFQSSYWNYIVPIINNTSPLQTLSQLQTYFLDKNDDERGLCIYNQNGSGGHIVNAYKITIDTVTWDTSYIYIYDNNYPNDTTRKIKIHNSQNCWWYNLSPNGDVGAWEWGGFNANRGLDLCLPASFFYNAPNIDSVSKKNLLVGKDKSGNIEIYNSEGCDFSIRDASGNITGYLAGQVYQDIPNSVAMVPGSGSSQVPIGYFLPDDNYTITMNNFSSTGLYFNLIGNSNTYTYSRSGATLPQEDVIAVGSAGLSVTNNDNTSKIITLGTIIENTDNEMTVDISDLGLSSGSTVNIVPVDSSRVKLISTGLATTYQLDVRYLNVNGEANYSNSSISLQPNCAHYITPDWDNLQTQNVTIYVDCGDDGTNEDTLYYGNQQVPSILTSVFEKDADATVQTDTIYITNNGGGTLNWSVSSGAPSWLTITSGSTGTDYGYFVISIAANSGAARSTDLTITGAGASNSPYLIPVSQDGTLSVPSNVNASDGNYSDGVHVSWDAVSGATDYMLYRSDNAGSNGTAITGWSSSTTYTDASANNGIFYYYSVKAAQDASGLNATDYSAMDDGWRSCFTADYSYTGTCTGQPTLFEDMSSAHTSAYYLWDINNDGSIEYTGNSVSHTFTSAGNYSVKLSVTDSSLCYDDIVQSFTVLSFPDINLPSDTLLCPTESITLDAGSGFNSYLWSTGATIQSITIDSSGYGLGTFGIYVLVSNVNGCSTIDTTVVTWSVCTEDEGQGNNEFRMNIYPNPANEIVNISLNGLKSVANLTIFNMNGQMVFKETIEDNGSSWIGAYHFSGMNKGIYFVRIVTNENAAIGKIVIY